MDAGVSELSAGISSFFHVESFIKLLLLIIFVFGDVDFAWTIFFFTSSRLVQLENKKSSPSDIMENFISESEYFYFVISSH